MITIIVDILLLCLGISIVLWGADKFTEGAACMARRWNVSEMVIGLTVVSMGTSMPEFVVSFISALEGSADMSVGNVVGSNIFNALIIVGLSAVFISLPISKKLLSRDIMFVIFSSIILVALGQDKVVNRYEGLVLVLCFCMYLYYSYYSSKNEKEDASDAPIYGWTKTILFVLLGIACLVGGGQILVSSATSLALTCGMSERMVGLTILAAGTSLPELATSIVAARKGSKGIALGNAVGSNLFNIFFVLGLSATICPLAINGISTLDWTALIGSSIVLFIFGRSDHKITRTEGFLMLTMYILYMVALIMGWQVNI